MHVVGRYTFILSYPSLLIDAGVILAMIGHRMLKGRFIVLPFKDEFGP